MSSGGRSPAGRGALGGVFAREVPWSRVDWPTVVAAALLFGVGLLVVRAMAEAELRWEREGIDFAAHLKKAAVALAFLPAGLLVRPRWLRRNAGLVYVGAMVLLALVPWIGQERNNARRWIQTPLFDVQPSEFVKLALIVVLARVLYRNRLRVASDWLGPIALALSPMALVAFQPDLGTALTLVPITLGMLWLAGARGRPIVAILAAGLVAGALVWNFRWIEEYQLRRVDTWVASFSPESLIENRRGAAFHAYHARLAIGNGGWRGTGLGRGIANRAGHLPERESDSIFAVIAEEAGLVGASTLLGLYALLVLLLLATAAGIRERYARLVVGGIACYFASHYLINVGVNLGLLPMTGLTLPLLSTGGSSLMATFLALGLALGLSARREPSLDEDAFRV